MSQLRIRKVAVLGAGVMGAQIAAHLVNADVDTLLFDLPAKEGDKNGIVMKAIANLGKLSPAPLALKSKAAAIIPANYEQHLALLADCDLIAEAWDAGGLYQVGNFPAYGRWMEWNGKFRDCARGFLKGVPGVVGEMVQRIMGSPDLYAAAKRKPTASVNFITCHDGFTLRDLFSYNGKHNLENGENNADGTNDNHSWNCGAEGETDIEAVLALRDVDQVVATDMDPRALACARENHARKLAGQKPGPAI
jgi:hypothetical protein